MSFLYKIVSEDEGNILRSKLIDAGKYNFEVVNAKFTYSQAGNEMIVLDLKVWDNEGKEHVIKDYLVNIDSMQFKTRHFCQAVGLTQAYESNKFDETLCQGRKGKVEIVIDKGGTKKDGKTYNPSNKVADYVRDVAGEHIDKIKREFTDDIIPF